jgi:predicted GNAT superfamily acetyltransferase
MEGDAPAGAESAWEAARRAGESAGVGLRTLKSEEEFGDALGVMAATWGSTQLIGQELLRAFEASGNVLIGAYEGDVMVGFVLGFFGHDEEGFHHHSHMLAALPDRRHRGVGYALKLAQRAAVLDAGVGVVRWTFDPLVARNAHFNLTKLGAVADRFHRNFYGAMDDDINRGDRSDRLEIHWDLRSALPKHVIRLERAHVVLAREGPADLPRPSGVRPPEAGGAAMIQIPREYPALREVNPDLARAWRDATAEAMEACYAKGLVATGFLKEGAYVLDGHTWTVRIIEGGPAGMRDGA